MTAVGCAPLNTTYETAAVVPKGKGEAQGNFSYYRSSSKAPNGNRESQTESTNLGIGFGAGIARNLDVKLRYELFVLTEDRRDAVGSQVHFASVAPKYSFGNLEQVAIKVPVGGYFWKDDHQWVVSPQLLVTPMRRPNRDLTLGGKIDLWLGDGAEDINKTVGLTLGMGFGKNVAVAALRPELGVLFSTDSDNDGFVMTFGAAYTSLFGGRKARR